MRSKGLFCYSVPSVVFSGKTYAQAVKYGTDGNCNINITQLHVKQKMVGRPNRNLAYNRADKFKLKKGLKPIEQSIQKPNECRSQKPISNKLILGLWNAQSIRCKTEMTLNVMNDSNIDIYYIVESWLKDDDLAVIGALEDGGTHRLINKPRIGRSGGGICCLYRSALNVKHIPTKQNSTFEILETFIETKYKNFTVVTIYRPGATERNRYTMCEFFDELSVTLSYYHTYRHEVIVIGDFNIHVNKFSDTNARKLADILEMFNLKQHISEATHENGNTLDLVITPEISSVQKCIVDDLNSDHNSILIHLDAMKTNQKQNTISWRPFKNWDINAFKRDVKHNLLQKTKKNEPQEELDTLMNCYLRTNEVLEKHAPLSKKKVVERKPTPWSKADIENEKSLKRRLEKKWKRSKTDANLTAYKMQRNKYNTLLTQKRNKFLSDMISQNSNNSRKLFKALNTTLNRKTELPLPPHNNDLELAENFSTFFKSKIDKIRTELDIYGHTTPYESNSFIGAPLLNFRKND